MPNKELIGELVQQQAADLRGGSTQVRGRPHILPVGSVVRAAVRRHVVVRELRLASLTFAWVFKDCIRDKQFRLSSAGR